MACATSRSSANQYRDIRKKLLMVRVVWQWNRLPQEGVDSPSLDIVKQRLERHMLEMLMKDFLLKEVGWTR